MVAKHIDLAAPGGHVAIAIPNLRGLNAFLCRIFAPWLLPIHNRKIMKLAEFRKLFDDERIEPLVCQHYGTFSFNIFHDGARQEAWRQRALAACLTGQLLLNLAFRRCLGDRGAEDVAGESLSPVHREKNEVLTFLRRVPSTMQVAVDER